MDIKQMNNDVKVAVIKQLTSLSPDNFKVLSGDYYNRSNRIMISIEMPTPALSEDNQSYFRSKLDSIQDLDRKVECDSIRIRRDISKATNNFSLSELTSQFHKEAYTVIDSLKSIFEKKEE